MMKLHLNDSRDKKFSKKVFEEFYDHFGQRKVTMTNDDDIIIEEIVR